ncbi:MAG: GIY-YIG nuclease family protein [Candidatus Omnitrophica bacterium]|nr:GIY-YIG nuclease family protein [Candidatus Omnitrophota bacterium]
MACVYILQSYKDKKLHVGSTRGKAGGRLAKHNAGLVRSTKTRRPFTIDKHIELNIYQEAKKKSCSLKLHREGGK